MGAFKAGAALLAVRLGAPIVPIKIEGAYEILRKGQALPHRGRIVVKIGEAVQVDQHADYREAIRVVEDRVRVL